MPRILQYILLFLGVSVLQIFLLDNLQWSLYLHPFAYLAFVLLLPMEIKGYLLLLLAAGMGCTMDFLSGIPGVNTAAVTAMAFCRPTLLQVFVGKELVGDGGVPNAARIGTGKFLRYATGLTLIHALVFYTLETLSAHQLAFTFLRILSSTASTLVVLWCIQLLFVNRKPSSR
ncbi:MAG: rod shape-determining protein MreD [Rikenellaceae bacterium]|nr:rod shape-determining protein MreD [Rikenellaceae bacterium]